MEMMDQISFDCIQLLILLTNFPTNLRCKIFITYAIQIKQDNIFDQILQP